MVIYLVVEVWASAVTEASILVREGVGKLHKVELNEYCISRGGGLAIASIIL